LRTDKSVAEIDTLETVRRLVGENESSLKNDDESEV
jgi:hypothetical protein